ncbi:unnamed protein product [Moneuplotes crassus]|uniref:Uncharacterized protein n=1 Tax=Euplotes crassus TaxID=5936 RepID=A0AAD2CY91_EUPCR|nr:unnamed protein product [Moneuplotes crassus]
MGVVASALNLCTDQGKSPRDCSYEWHIEKSTVFKEKNLISYEGDSLDNKEELSKSQIIILQISESEKQTSPDKIEKCNLSDSEEYAPENVQSEDIQQQTKQNEEQKNQPNIPTLAHLASQESLLQNSLTSFFLTLHSPIHDSRYSCTLLLPTTDNFTVNLSCHEAKLFMRSMKSLVLPELKSIRVENWGRDKRSVEEGFWGKSFPRKCCSFILTTNSLCKIDRSMKQILAVSWKVSVKLYLYQFRIKQKHFMKILVAARNMLELCIHYCVVEMESSPNFGKALNGSNIRLLMLWESRIIGPKGIEDSLDGFENLIDGLSKSEDFKRKLEYLYVSSQSSKKHLDRILKSYGLGKVKLHTI